MLLKILNLPFLLLFISISLYSQKQIIATPNIESLEKEFLSVIQKVKLEKLIFLNEKVKEVRKKNCRIYYLK